MPPLWQEFSFPFQPKRYPEFPEIEVPSRPIPPFSRRVTWEIRAWLLLLKGKRGGSNRKSPFPPSSISIQLHSDALLMEEKEEEEEEEG